MYVSQWKTYAAAQRFAEVYKAGLVKRSKVSDPSSAKAVECTTINQGCTAKWSAHFDTDDGAVVMEISSSNTLIITQGLNESAVGQVKQALSSPSRKAIAGTGSELSLRLAGTPAVRAMREEMFQAISEEFTKH